jgi:hypothetical protein
MIKFVKKDIFKGLKERHSGKFPGTGGLKSRSISAEKSS